MISKTIKFVDFNGDEQEKTFYFHLSKTELILLNYANKGGLEGVMQRAVAAEDTATIVSTIMEFVLKGYGRRSEDGASFSKDPIWTREFECSPAFDIIMFELLTDESGKASNAFMKGMVPADALAELAKRPNLSFEEEKDITEADILAARETKPWITEKREPTRKELATMSREDLVEAYGRKVGKENL